MTEWDQQKFIILKALMGDRGDNVPPIKPKMGMKTAAKLICEPGGLSNLISQSAELKENFKRNFRLVSLTCIPNDVKLEIDKAFDEARVV